MTSLGYDVAVRCLTRHARFSRQRVPVTPLSEATQLIPQQ